MDEASLAYDRFSACTFNSLWILNISIMLFSNTVVIKLSCNVMNEMRWHYKVKQQQLVLQNIPFFLNDALSGDDGALPQNRSSSLWAMTTWLTLNKTAHFQITLKNYYESWPMTLQSPRIPHKPTWTQIKTNMAFSSTVFFCVMMCFSTRQSTHTHVSMSSCKCGAWFTVSYLQL